MKSILVCIVVALVPSSIICGQPSTMPDPTQILRKALLTATLAPEKTISSAEIKEVTLGPRVRTGLHLHPCPVVGVITEGTISFQTEGSAVQQLRPGDAFYEPANVRVLHFDNNGGTPARFVAIYLLGKDEHELIRLLPEARK